MGAVIVVAILFALFLAFAVFFAGPAAVELFDDTLEEWRELLEERKAKKEER